MAALAVTVASSLLLYNVNAVVVNNTDFLIDIPDDWAYRDSNNPLANALGVGAYVGSIPNAFSKLLINTSQAISGDAIKNEGAYSIFTLDTEYPYRNIPLETYTEYNINLYPVKIFSKENTTVGGEKAIKIYRSPRNNLTNIQVVDYYVIHDSKPYYLQYAANVKDFQKYLLQFEQMVKTFRFIK